MNELDVGKRLIDVRRRAKLTQRALAARAAVPHSLIAMIEKNRSSPSIASLRKILNGIPMTLGQFFEASEFDRTQIVFRPEELTDLTSRIAAPEGGGPAPIVLSQVGDAIAHGLQILHEHYDPGADTGPTMLEHEAHEGGVIVSGEIELTVDDEIHVLKAGDAYLFDSRRPHRFRNRGDVPTKIISACTPPYL